MRKVKFSDYIKLGIQCKLKVKGFIKFTLLNFLHKNNLVILFPISYFFSKKMKAKSLSIFLSIHKWKLHSKNHKF